MKGRDGWYLENLTPMVSYSCSNKINLALSKSCVEEVLDISLTVEVEMYPPIRSELVHYPPTMEESDPNLILAYRL